MGSQRCKSLCSTWSEERSNHCKSTSSPQNQGLFLQQTCAACAAVSLYLLRMFLHNWKAYHFPVYQDIARKSFCPRVHLHLRFVNLGPVRSVWPTKKKVCMGGKSGVRIEICLVADAPRFRGGACRKMQGMSTYLLRYGASHPLCCRMPQLRVFSPRQPANRYPDLAEVAIPSCRCGISPSSPNRCCSNSR